MSSPVLQIRLPEDLLEWVKERAGAERLEPSRWVRQMLQDLQLADAAAPLGKVTLDPVIEKGQLLAVSVGIQPEDVKIPKRCNRGACRGTLHPRTGRCLICNQKPA